MRGLTQTVLICLFVLSVPLSGMAQYSRHDQRRFNKAAKKYHSIRYDEAEKILRPLCAKYPHEPAAWDLLAQVQLMKYNQLNAAYPAYSFPPPDTSITLSHAERERDSLGKIFMGLMNDQLPSFLYLKACIGTWREATLRCGDAQWPSLLLRNFLLETQAGDSSFNPNAIHEFHDAEEAFAKQNYSDALSHYRRVVLLDPSFYKARLYLGDTWLKMKEYVQAAACFRELISLYPQRIEPRKYLADALRGMNAYEDAAKEIIEALTIYPDANLFARLSEVASEMHKHFDRHWTERVVFPNTVGDQPLNEKGDRTWMEYINGFSLIEPYCNKEGVIVKSNERTKLLYSEVYSWEYMLAKTGPDNFPFARRMQQAGYLDCYVMVSEYHVDFQPQYEQFSRQNKERIRDYLHMLMNL